MLAVRGMVAGKGGKDEPGPHPPRLPTLCTITMVLNPVRTLHEPTRLAFRRARHRHATPACITHHALPCLRHAHDRQAPHTCNASTCCLGWTVLKIREARVYQFIHAPVLLLNTSVTGMRRGRPTGRSRGAKESMAPTTLGPSAHQERRAGA